MTLHMPEYAVEAAGAEQALVEASHSYSHIFSHDIGGKLRVIMEFARVLQDEKATVSEEDAQLYLSLILDTSTQLYRMTEGLVAYARLDGVAFTPVKVDVQALIEGCMVDLEPMLSDAGGHIAVEGLPEIRVDVSMFRQLIHALLDNAIKFQRQDLAPVIRVTAASLDSDWVFSVSDNGIGIEPAFYEKVLKPGKKLHTDDAYAGAGMGLALARKIVNRHGGRIWIETSENGGTTIKFTIKTSVNQD